MNDRADSTQFPETQKKKSNPSLVVTRNTDVDERKPMLARSGMKRAIVREWIIKVHVCSKLTLEMNWAHCTKVAMGQILGPHRLAAQCPEHGADPSSKG